jgi:SAM-dependent methyltransferase
VDEHLERTRAFFAPRAVGWDAHFPDDQPVYAAAAAELLARQTRVVVDLGCGTGRALTALRRAAGTGATVIGVDVTPEMLRAAAASDRQGTGELVLADVDALPLRPASVDAFFAAGILGHVPDPARLLQTLASFARPGARLAVFQPIGRAALAARHQRALQPDELLDPSVLPDVLAGAGWTIETLDDGESRYLAIAGRA